LSVHGHSRDFVEGAAGKIEIPEAIERLRALEADPVTVTPPEVKSTRPDSPTLMIPDCPFSCQTFVSSKSSNGSILRSSRISSMIGNW
jgi:hypothetical protein